MDMREFNIRLTALEQRIVTAKRRAEQALPHPDCDPLGAAQAREDAEAARLELVKLENELVVLKDVPDAERRARSLDWLPEGMQQTVRHSDRIGFVSAATSPPGEVLAVPLEAAPLPAVVEHHINEERAARGERPLSRHVFKPVAPEANVLDYDPIERALDRRAPR